MTLLYPLFVLPATVCLGAFLMLRTGAGDDWPQVVARPVLQFLRPDVGTAGFNFALLALAVIFMALTSPSTRADRANAYALDEGLSILVDVSRSMGVADLMPSRVVVARAAASQISAQAGARPTSLVAYAGDAYLVQPFAVDRRQFDAFVASLDVGLVPQEGSNLERALALATTTIEESGVGRARIVIVGDGGGFGTETGFIAGRLSERGHRVDVVLTADPATTTPVAIDMAAVERVVDAGGGVLIVAGPDGDIDLDALALGDSFLRQSRTFELALRSTEWRNLSHFLLLMALPAVLLLFRQVRQ